MDRLEIIASHVLEFERERDWDQFHDPKNLAMAIASEAGELLAEFRWVRTEEVDTFSADPARQERIKQEMGDVAIALISMCNRLGVDFGEIVEAKLATNRKQYPVETSRGNPERPK